MPNVSYQDDGGGGGGGGGDGVLGGTVFRVIQRCDFFYTLMSSVLLGGLTSIAVVALTRKHCNSFHYSARTVVQCRTGNRRRRTFPATEPNRAAVKLPCCIRAQLKRVLQAQFFRSAARHQTELNVLNPTAAIVRSNRTVTVTFVSHLRCVQQSEFSWSAPKGNGCQPRT